MKTLLKIAAASSIILLVSAAIADCKDRGTWTAQPSDKGPNLLEFKFNCAHDNGSTDRPLNPTELQGLDPAAING